MKRAIALLLLLPCVSYAADQPDWARNAFQKPDGTYKYFIGISAPLPSEFDAVADARRNAVTNLIQQEFGSDTSVTIDSRETTQGAVIQRKSRLQVDKINLAQFELMDQIILPPHEDRFVAKVLFRYPIATIESERQRLAQLPPAPEQPVANVAAELDKAHAADRARQEKNLERKDLYAWAYPRLGIDLGAGYLGFSGYGFGSLSAGLRLQTLSFLYIGFAGTWGVLGSDHVTGTAPANTAPNYDSDSGSSFGPFIRLYLQRDNWPGCYVRGFASFDRVAPTCSKDGSGSCTSPTPPAQSGMSYGAGFGVGGGLALEVNYGVSTILSHMIAVNLILTIPVIRQTYLPAEWRKL